MLLEGTIRNGTIVLDHPETFQEGTRVTVSVEPTEENCQVEVIVPVIENHEPPTFLDLLEFAGCMPDMPADFAEQHDHYIHGTPKR